MEPPANSSDLARSRWDFSAVWQGILLGCIFIALSFLLYGLPWLGKIRRPTVLVDTSVYLPPSAAKIVRLHVPKPGKLALNLAGDRDGEFSVALAPARAGKASAPDQMRPAIDAFSADQVRIYHRSGRIEAGEYELVLTSANHAKELSPVKVRARLDP